MNRKFGCTITIVVSIIAIIASLSIEPLREITTLIVSLLPLLVLILVFTIPILLILYTFFTGKNIYSSISNIDNWLDKPSISHDKLTKALNVDYASPSVSYEIRRLGDESYRPTFPKEYEQSQFIIDGDYITIGKFTFSFNDIQWFGRYKKSSSVRLSVNIDGFWYRISLLPMQDKDKFYQEVFKRIPEKLKRSKYLNRPDVSSFEGTKAHTTQQNLHGIFEDFEAVELYVTPLWLVVISNGYVIEQHFIDDIEDIRSVKHPTHINDDMLLLTFSIGDDVLMYSYEDTDFVTRLSDATRSGFDTSAPRKKKQNEN